MVIYGIFIYIEGVTFVLIWLLIGIFQHVIYENYPLVEITQDSEVKRDKTMFFIKYLYHKNS